MDRKELVDSLVVGEYREFAEDPFGYSAERERCVERLTGSGAERGEALGAWEEFERRYLVHDGGGLTLSAHGIDRAGALGEEVHLDQEARDEVVRVLRDADEEERVTFESIASETGLEHERVVHNLWMLSRRGVVETRADANTGARYVSETRLRADPEVGSC